MLPRAAPERSVHRQSACGHHGEGGVGLVDEGNEPGGECAICRVWIVH